MNPAPVNITDLASTGSGHSASSNTLGVWRGKVCDGVGFVFDYRKLRRTYGQYLLDEGFSMEEVSILLGHTNVTTTNAFYAGVRPSRAVQNVLSGWQKSSGSDEQNGDDRRFMAGTEHVVQGKGFEPSNSYENRP